MSRYSFLLVLNMPLGIHFDGVFETWRADEIIEHGISAANTLNCSLAMLWIRCAYSNSNAISYYELWCGMPHTYSAHLFSSLVVSPKSLPKQMELKHRLRFIENHFSLSLQQNYSFDSHSERERISRRFHDTFLEFFFDFSVSAHGGRAQTHSLNRERFLEISLSAVNRFNATSSLYL